LILLIGLEEVAAAPAATRNRTHKILQKKIKRQNSNGARAMSLPFEHSNNTIALTPSNIDFRIPPPHIKI
jgi:hypothetical protein